MNKPLPDDTKVSVARLCTAAEKLARETERLRRDVVALNQRVQPIEGPGATWIEEPPAERKVWKAVDALNLIVAASANILKHELSAIRARIDAIERHAISREEMKPWIKQSS
jgi:prefoldin subunit 5